MATRTSIRWCYLSYSAKVVIGSLECINVSLQPRWLVQRMPRLLRVKGMRKTPPYLAGKEHGVSCTYVQCECKCRHCHIPKCKPSAWYGTFLFQNKSKTQTTRSLTHSIPIQPDYSRVLFKRNIHCDILHVDREVFTPHPSFAPSLPTRPQAPSSTLNLTWQFRLANSPLPLFLLPSQEPLFSSSQLPDHP